jgi:hemerythrin-like domain-containing protein
MEATRILMEEHRVIERVIAALEAGADRLEAGEQVRPEFFIQVTDFIQGFADGCHHVKEEGVLFPAMQDHGVPVQVGPIGVMLHEHEQGRALTRDLRLAAEKLQGGDASASADVIRSAFGYGALLRQHILKEDNILFPMAEHAIPTAQHAQVLSEFERVEHEETGEGVHEKYLALAEALENEIGS